MPRIKARIYDGTPQRRPGRVTCSTKDLRRDLFIKAYLSNGNNGVQAALTAGYASSNAHKRAYELLAQPEIKAMVQAQAAAIAEKADMSLDTWARDLRAVAFSNPAELFGIDGRLRPFHELPEATQRAVSSIEVAPDGTTKVKFWSKTAALETMGKHLGMFERDNRQKISDIKVAVVLVG